MMAYRAADGRLHHLSTNPNDPTRLNGDAAELFATSYTAELIAPSYKKVVAVLGEYGQNPNARSQAATLTNQASDLCKILPGRQQRIALSTKYMDEGTVYTILYTSMDYAGHTSTRRYYVTK